MKFDTLKSFNKTKLIISGTIISCLILVVTLFVSHSKYVYKDNITIMDGTINYTPYDFKIMAMYQQKEDCKDTNSDNCYTEIEKMPTSGYEINTEKTYCFVDYDDEDNKIKGKVYTNSDGEHVIKELPKRSKCVIYFDKAKTASENSFDELASLNPSLERKGPIGEDGFTDVETKSSINQVYEAEDNDGTSYYYRGDVQDNYVKFGKMGNDDNGDDIWWRIIRINGDGSIRMIYAGTGNSDTAPDQRQASTTMINNGSTSYQFNTQSNDNMYVGFEYVSGIRNGHANNTGGGSATPSNALTSLNTWFQENLKDELDDPNSKIDKNAGFCGDRSAYSGKTSETKDNETYGVNKQVTYYGSYIRNYPKGSSPGVGNPVKPTYKCEDEDNDLYTYKNSNKGTKSLEYPIGLISADEVTYAGGLLGYYNTSYYLYNSSYYWTVSPYDFNDSHAGVFGVDGEGKLGGCYVNDGRGLRPVLNLMSGALKSGTGVVSDPYKVS